MGEVTRRPAGRCRGFTLVEVLVVLLVVTILLGYISLKPLSGDRACREEAWRMSRALELIRDEAVIGFHPLAMEVRPDGYGAGEGLEAGLSDSNLSRRLPAGCRIVLPEGEETARIVFSPQGFATPAEFYFSCNGRSGPQISVDPGGGVELSTAEGEPASMAAPNQN